MKVAQRKRIVFVVVMVMVVAVAGVFVAIQNQFLELSTMWPFIKRTRKKTAKAAAPVVSAPTPVPSPLPSTPPSNSGVGSPPVSSGLNYSVQNNIGVITDGDLRLEVDFNYGGTIRHLSQASLGMANVINYRDAGRRVGGSIYMNPESYSVPGGVVTNPQYYTTSWNIVQAGDDGDNGSPLTETPTWDANTATLYTKCKPLQWKFRNAIVEETSRIESWYTFLGTRKAIRVRHRIAINRLAQGQTDFGRAGEYPYVYVRRDLDRPVGYRGNNPWSNAATSLLEYNVDDNLLDGAVAGSLSREQSENWFAQVGQDGKGLGFYVPQMYQNGFFYFTKIGDVSQGTGVLDYPCVCMQQKVTLDITANFVLDVTYELKLGDVSTIRQYVYQRKQDLQL